ncbi:hypothetical protein [Saccharothrix luteola]|uniref:hypothetical protein n=1 Tax=Saccharothrix luteola TaxID=2893018 RepID=UPI001E4495B8|nr:hypothetical protein [Saccharothrix luteola]MCC8246342.1 hypothetical protein [Saccharothrix luteola]
MGDVRRSIAVVGLVTLIAAGCGGRSEADYERVAKGPQASADRVAAAESGRARVAALRALVPWHGWPEHSLDQSCGVAGHRHMSQVFGPDDGHVSCSTVLVWYAGFDGDLAEEIRRFDGLATGAGWSGSESDVHMSIDYYARYRGRPEGPRTYDASNLPGLGYLDPRDDEQRGSTCSGSSNDWTLRQRWLEAGQPLPAHEPDGADALVRDSPTLLHDEQPLDHAAVKTALLAQHRYVAVTALSLHCAYYFD